MAEVKLNEADYQLLQAKSNLETGLMALNSLIGIELHTATEIDSVIPPVVIPDEIKQSDVSDRPGTENCLRSDTYS